MKIAVIVPNKYPIPAVRGGAVEGLVEQLLEQNERFGEMEIVVYSPYDEKALAEAQKYSNSKVVYIRRKKYDVLSENKAVTLLNLYYSKYTTKSVVYYPYVHRLLKEIGNEEKSSGKCFDLVICESGEYVQYKALSDYVGKKRMVIHIHGKMDGNTALKNWFSHYICVSSFIGRTLIENGSISSEQVDVLSNGISTENLARNSPEENKKMRADLGYTDEDIVLIYWGRIIPEKGVRELVQAFQIALSTDARLRLLLFGGAHFGNESSLTDYERTVASMCSECGQIQLRGFIENNKLKQYISACDLAVLPSICEEAGSLAMIEAACIGIPMITTGTGGMREYIRESEHFFVTWTPNFVCDLADKILELVSHPEMGRAARENAEYYRKTYNSEQYYHNYLRLVQKYMNEGQ